LKLAPEAQLLEKDIHARYKHSSFLDTYHTYPQVEQDLQNFVQKYPKLASLETYGKTAENRTLYALKLTAGNARGKPELMISAATHGDEVITTEVLLLLVKELLEGYPSNQRFSKMLDSHVIYILPVASPDGLLPEKDMLKC
jgi:murein tripeptide amidase MpaA